MTGAGKTASCACHQRRMVFCCRHPTLFRQPLPYQSEWVEMAGCSDRLVAPHFWWGGCAWRWRFGEPERRSSVALAGPWRRRPETRLPCMLLTGLHQPPVDAHQRQTANQPVSRGPCRHGEGQPATIRAKGFHTVAGVRMRPEAPAWMTRASQSTARTDGPQWCQVRVSVINRHTRSPGTSSCLERPICGLMVNRDVLFDAGQ